MIQKALLLGCLVLTLSGCAGLSNREQRALTGGVLGAGAGAAIGAISGGSPVTGAVIGGAAGAIGGALIPDDHDGRKGRNRRR